MSFSALGPHVWVPRRRGLGDAAADAKNYAVAQGLAYVPGGFSLPPNAGTIEAGVKADALNYAAGLSAQAQGYVSSALASSALGSYAQQTGITVPYVPITTDPNVLGKWAQQQFKVWSSRGMQSSIDYGKKLLDAAGVPEPPATGYGKVLDEYETHDWIVGYLATNTEMLTHPTPEGALRLAQSFVQAQGFAIGVPPEFIAAAGLLTSFPTDVASAEAWAVKLGTAYLSQFGVPIVTSFSATGFLQAAGRFAIADLTPGIPFSLCESTFSALKDGVVNYAEAQGLVVGACSWIGGAIGQMFGLPAPLGAILGQFLGELLVGPVAKALGFGPSDHELLNAAQVAARKAAAAETIICTDQARALWLNYQHYWDSVEGHLQALFTANQEWLTPGAVCTTTSGIRLFPEVSPGSNTLAYVIDPSTGQPVMNYLGLPGDKTHAVPVVYKYPVSRYCGDMTGCAYNATKYGPVFTRDDYPLSVADLAQGLKDCPVGSLTTSGCPQIHSSAYGCGAIDALAFWNARRYVTPFQVLLEMWGAPGQAQVCDNGYCMQAGSPNMYVRSYTGKRATQTGSNAPEWDSVVHSDEEYLAYIGHVDVAGEAGTEVGQCLTPAWAQAMMGSLQQAPAASALVQRDLARTLSYVTTAFGIQKHAEDLAGNQWAVLNQAQQRQAANLMAARAATMRNAVREARRRGRMESDMLNYGFFAAGGAALAGWAFARRRR